MAANAILVLCAQAFLAQCAYSQYCGRIASSCGNSRFDWPYENAFITPSYGAVAPLAGVAPASGGGLPIASASPIPPSGLSVASENAIDGILAVAGDLPFVSAVALEGPLPTAGAGSVAYSCGDGSIGMFSVGAAPAFGLADGLGFAAARDMTFGTAINRPGFAAPFGITRDALGVSGLPLAGKTCGLETPAVEVVPSSGGALPIASASPITPSGVAVASENAIDGILAVSGNLPFVSAVALEGPLPTAGAGSVAYGCGDGSIGMLSAGAAPALGLADGLAYGAGLAAPYRGLGLTAPIRSFDARTFGRGCNTLY